MLAALLLAAGLQAPAAPADGVGPAVGERIPSFRAADQAGRLRSFADLRGPKGLVLVFFRSADW